jgi:AbrB family looped-hinge helix DNA binding protein
MPAFSTISSEGQIAVPLEIRDHFGLKAGDQVEFVVDRGQTVLRPNHFPRESFEKHIGSLRHFKISGE